MSWSVNSVEDQSERPPWLLAKQSFLLALCPIRPMTITLTVLVWIAVNLSPIVIAPRMWLINLDPFSRSVSLAGVFSALIVELLFLLLLFGLLKRSLLCSKKGIFVMTLVLTPLTFVAVMVYFLLLGASWTLFLRTSSFLDIQLMRALFANLNELLLYTPKASLQPAAFVLGIVCAVIFWLYLIAPPLAKRRHIMGLGAITVCFVCVSYVLLVAYPMNHLSTQEGKFFRLYVRNNTIPHLSLAWQYGLYATRRQIYQKKLVLEKQSSLQQFLDEVQASTKLEPERPNVLILIIEAMRNDILEQSGGDPRILVNINQLAQSGLFYPNCIAQSTESSYSKVTILTGLYPLISEFRNTFSVIRYPVMRIYDLLKAIGYRVASFNSTSDLWQNVSNILRPDHFDYFYEATKAHHDRITMAQADKKMVDEVKTWIRRESKSSSPFYAHLYFVSTHFPFYQNFEGPHIFSPHKVSVEEGRLLAFENYPQHLSGRMKNRYYNALHYVDSLIGEIMSELAESGVRDNTVVIITGDHGESFHEHGIVNHANNLYQQSAVVPLIIWAGEKIDLQGQTHFPTAHIDIAPTILKLLGLPPHGNLQGVAAASAAEDLPRHSLRRPIFSSTQGLSHEDSVTYWPWKLIINHRIPQDRLYHLEQDPEEHHNLMNAERAIGHCLKEVISKFRRSQFTYYNGDARYYEQYYPPRYDSYLDPCLSGL